MDVTTGAPMVVKMIERSLYGLSQSPALWHGSIDNVSLGIDFTPIVSDPCVYTHSGNDTFAILRLYFDHILITGRNSEVVQHLKKALKERFAMKDMGKHRLILGMPITPRLQPKHADHYAEELCPGYSRQSGMLDSRATHTPG